MVMRTWPVTEPFYFELRFFGGIVGMKNFFYEKSQVYGNGKLLQFINESFGLDKILLFFPAQDVVGFRQDELDGGRSRMLL